MKTYKFLVRRQPKWLSSVKTDAGYIVTIRDYYDTALDIACQCGLIREL